ncbi:hypothetical protein Hte_002988 [Hypoxylon texense]
MASRKFNGKVNMNFLSIFPRFLPSIGADTIWHSGLDLKLLILLRTIRLLGYGGTTLILALYLHSLGFNDYDVGLFMTLTLIGDLLISFGLTYIGDGMGFRPTAVIGGTLMCVGGIAFAYLDNYWLLLLASIVGVINPSANEIDPFKAIEESAVARLSTSEHCNLIFAWWSMLGMLGTAASNMLTGLLVDSLCDSGLDVREAHRVVFMGYAGIGLVKVLVCLFISPQVEIELHNKNDAGDAPAISHQHSTTTTPENEPLLDGTNTNSSYSTYSASVHSETSSTNSQPLSSPAKKRPMFVPTSFSFMWKLSVAMLFDFIGSGLAQISWMVYFFKREYGVAEGILGSATFTAGIISSLLNLVSWPMSKAVGQVPTMVICHTINSISLLMVSVPANRNLALALFIFRIVTREIDNAPRQAFISAAVLTEERTSAMGVVNIVKTVGSCVGLYATGVFAGLDKFWLAFIAAGCLKLVYNILIAAFFWRNRE